MSMIKYLLRQFCGSYFDFSIERMSIPLFRLPRFVGWGESVITVGQHSTHCYYLARLKYPEDYRIQLLALIHDVPEIFYGDIPSYVKHALGEDAKDLFDQIDEEIYAKLGVESPLASEQKQIKELDLTALTLEAWYIFSGVDGYEWKAEDWPTPFTWGFNSLHQALHSSPDKFIKTFRVLKELNAKES